MDDVMSSSLQSGQVHILFPRNLIKMHTSFLNIFMKLDGK